MVPETKQDGSKTERERGERERMREKEKGERG